MKYKWDNKNVLDYAVQEAEAKGKEEGAHDKALTIARELKKEGLALEFIAKTTGLLIDELKTL
ncbi:hypothetical protein [Mucilaginibacter pedocola]|nr:hypothetical protein [Mucilaginibacter pedocola]